SRSSAPVPAWILASPRIARRSLRRRFSAAIFGLNIGVTSDNPSAARCPDHATYSREPLRPGYRTCEELRTVFAEPSRRGERHRPQRAASTMTTAHIFNNRFALPLAIFALSSSHSGTPASHAGAGAFASNG